jgi:hypothetical protein
VSIPAPSRRTLTTEHPAAENAVKSLAAGSRTIGRWLIAIAVLIQAAAGLWGLWRWRRAKAPDDTKPAAAERVAALELEGENDPWVETLRSSAALGSRPWTGELPVHRTADPPTSLGPPVPPNRPLRS